MVIFLNISQPIDKKASKSVDKNASESIDQKEIDALFKHYLTPKEIKSLLPGSWLIELGPVDREIADYITKKINGHYWPEHHVQLNAYCPLFQKESAVNRA